MRLSSVKSPKSIPVYASGPDSEYTSVALTAPNGYDQSKVDTSISELIGLFDIASERTRADALDLMSVVDMFCTRAARYTDLLIVDSWFGCRTFADT